MRIYYGGISNETNAFSPIPCSAADFIEADFGHGADTRRTLFGPLLDRGAEIVVGPNLIAQPAGPITTAAWIELRDALLADLDARKPFDAVLLNLHGAMATPDIEDCEADLLARVRERSGAHAFLGAALDPHCHLSDAMVELADALVCYKEYPHTDIAETTQALAALCARQLDSGHRAAAAMYDCKQLDLYHTTREPMRSFVARLRQLETAGAALSISIAHGFPWGDSASIGTKVLVYTDAAQDNGAALAATLGNELRALRGKCAPPLTSIDALLAAARATQGLIVAADLADNPGGGAPGDSTYVLSRLLATPPGPCAIGALWDPIATAFAFKAGLGATLPLRIGGKCSALSGAPVDLVAEVIGLSRDLHQTAPGYGGISVPTGDVAGLRVGDVEIALCSERTQTFSPEVFAAAGIALATRRLVVVKSTQHFHAGFGALAEQIFYIDAPGTLGFDLSALPYRRAPNDLWLRGATP